VPVQAPLQPVNVLPAAGVAVSVTDVPELYVALHVAPQLIPAGALVTVPVPDPAFVTVSACVTIVNVADTETGVLPEKMHGAVPEQVLPPQPPKVDVAAGVAESVTAVPAE
jgi:hypothetical protein